MRPRLTRTLLVRTVGVLAFLLWAAWSLFRVPGGTGLMRAAMGVLFGALLAETLLPFLRALPIVSEKGDFPLAAMQYVGIPVLGFLLLLGAVGALMLAGEFDTRAAIKAASAGAGLWAMIIVFAGRSWKSYRRQRRRTRQERLAALERDYEAGAISRQVYQDRKEAIYESMWKIEERRAG